jgi:DNA primase
MPRISDELLRRLRNEVSLRELLTDLDWPHRSRGGSLVFVCPLCGESRSDHNPEENLLRCFHCKTNFNPIDFLMAARRLEFVDAVHYLMALLH